MIMLYVSETQMGSIPSAAKYTLWPMEFLISYLLFVSKPVKAETVKHENVDFKKYYYQTDLKLVQT